MNPVAGSAAVTRTAEMLKMEILRYRAVRPEGEPAARIYDRVEVSGAGRLLSDMAAAGYPLSRGIAESLAAGKPDPGLVMFLQAYTGIYGADFSYAAGNGYDRGGAEVPEDIRESLRRALRGSGDGSGDSGADEKGGGFLRRLGKILRRIRRLLLGR